MIDIEKVIALLRARDAEKRANAKPVDMFFLAAHSAGRMSLEDKQKLNFAEAQKQYHKELRERGATFQDRFQNAGGREHLKALQEILNDPQVKEFNTKSPHPGRAAFDKLS